MNLAGTEALDLEPALSNAWVPCSAAAQSGPTHFCAFTQESHDGTWFLLRFHAAPHWAEFLLDPTASRVWVKWSEHATYEAVLSLLTGPVMGCLLRRREVLCLHGSVVAIDNRAIVILGHKGMGKSTTAAALAQQNCRVLSDDLAVIAERDAGFITYPGEARLRLWPSALKTLYGSVTDLPRVYSFADKRHVDLASESDFPTPSRHAPLALCAIYLLDPFRASLATPFICVPSPSASLLSLAAHSYASWILNSAMRAREFERLGRLARGVPVHQIARSADLEKLPEIADAILSDVRAISSNQHG